MRRTNTYTKKQVEKALGKRRAGKTLSDREKVICKAVDVALATHSNNRNDDAGYRQEANRCLHSRTRTMKQRVSNTF